MEVMTQEFGYDFITDSSIWNDDMSNKLFCTFTTEENLDTLIQEIKGKYDIMYNKIFRGRPARSGLHGRCQPGRERDCGGHARRAVRVRMCTVLHSGRQR